MARNLYYAVARAMGDEPHNAHNGTAPRHADISMNLPHNGGGGSLRFLWAPFAANLTSRLNKMASNSTKMPEVLIMCAGLWDALWVHDPNAFKKSVMNLQSLRQKQHFVDGMARRRGRESELMKIMRNKNEGAFERNGGEDAERTLQLPLMIWMDTTVVVDKRLATASKRAHMHDFIIRRFYSYHGANSDKTVSRTTLNYPNGIDGVIEARAVTVGRDVDSVDGVHYSDVVYDVLAQILLNQIRSASTYSLSDLYGKGSNDPSVSGFKENTDKMIQTKVEHNICEMARPRSAFVLLGIALTMLFAMDNFFGIPMVVMRLFGSREVNAKVSWDAAYAPLHRKIGVI